jgi:peptidoglycan/xylan/chitin deacetylase (PgdA/CDA1 family)
MTLDIYTHGRRDQPKVALTFDDGPNPPITDQILEILDGYGVRATFFPIGRWVERWPRAFDRMVDAGHVIGNHSYLHDRYVGDFDRAEAVLANVTGRPSQFVRAHFFYFHLCLESPLARSPQIRIVDADVNPADYSRSDPAEIVRLTLESEHLGGGSIIDLHDGGEMNNDAERLSRPRPLIEALPLIIEGLRKRGLEPVGLDEMELVDPTPWTPD